MAMFLVQLLMGMIGLMLTVVWPPASGRMLLVAIDGSDANALVIGAAAAGARVLGTGPLPHSLVVTGDRSTLSATFGFRHVVLLAASVGGCEAPVGEAAIDGEGAA